MQNRRHTTSHRAPPALSVAQQEELRQRWRRPWHDESAGPARMWPRGSVSTLVAGRLLAGVCLPPAPSTQPATAPPANCPRPQHVQADPAAQGGLQFRVGPLSCVEVATASPARHSRLGHRRASHRASHEHRTSIASPSSRSPRRIWAPIGQRPVAPVQHRYAWRYLAGFVHTASGRTLFHLATSVSIPLFEGGAAAFARQAGAGPDRQIVLVLAGQAGMPHSACACLTMSICSSCRRTLRAPTGGTSVAPHQHTADQPSF